MRKIFAVFIATLFALVFAPGAAQAAVTFHSGPTAVDNGLTLTVNGNVSGLGNTNVDVFLTAAGYADVTCTNPSGNVAPGQRTEVTSGGSQLGLEPKNGRTSFSITTNVPTNPTGAQACPNSKWSAAITDVHFTSYTITLVQGGVTIFSGTFAV
jgi:hypothetical protein